MSFADKETKKLSQTGKSRRFNAIAERALIKLDMLDAAADIKDLRSPPGNQLEALRGDRQEQHSIRINKQWRICFRFQYGDAYDVEITDYH